MSSPVETNVGDGFATSGSEEPVGWKTVGVGGRDGVQFCKRKNRHGQRKATAGALGSRQEQ